MQKSTDRDSLREWAINRLFEIWQDEWFLLPSDEAEELINLKMNEVKKEKNGKN